MATIIMNEYQVKSDDGTKVRAVRENIRDVANDLDTDATNPVVAIDLVETDVNVGVPDPVETIHFQTEIRPVEAELAGCHATPTEYDVPLGTKVIFEALQTGNYTFEGWFAPDGSALGTNFLEEIEIKEGVDKIYVVEARFLEST